MKTISVVIPCYNEEKSVAELYERLKKVFENDLPAYDYEIIYVDDYSKDRTRDEIKKLCDVDSKVKAVFNARNFGFDRNVFQSYSYATGDCAFMLFGDLQDPPELLPELVSKWEEGYQCVVGQRSRSDENPLLYGLRRIYYKVIDTLSDTKQIEMVNGFGLYDRAFLDILKQIDETKPFFKTVLNEYGINLCIVQYEQSVSKRGKSNFNFMKNYDFAMHGLTSSTKLLMRFATFIGVFVGVICMILAIYVFVRKILFWDTYPLGSASIMVGVFFLGAIQLFFIGVLGEYILSINERVTKKPRVVVEQTLNMDSNRQEEERGETR